MSPAPVATASSPPPPARHRSQLEGAAGLRGAAILEAACILLACAGLGWLISHGAIPGLLALLLATSVIVFGLPASLIHYRRGRSLLTGFVLGSTLTVFGLAVASADRPASPGREAAPPAVGSTLRRCPSCGYLAHHESKTCHFCRRDLPAEESPAPGR